MKRSLYIFKRISAAKLLTLIQPGEVKVDLALTLTSISGQNSYMSDFLKIDLFLQKRLANLFELPT
jgi:hypothetical protein